MDDDGWIHLCSGGNILALDYKEQKVMESAYERNLRLYPKLKKLIDRNFLVESRFLDSIREQMLVKPLTYGQAVSACRAIDEKLLQRSIDVR